jgi:hypothetical protein
MPVDGISIVAVQILYPFGALKLPPGEAQLDVGVGLPPIVQRSLSEGSSIETICHLYTEASEELPEPKSHV